MKIIWDVPKNDVKRLSAFMSESKENLFVKRRVERNVKRKGVVVNKKTIWRAAVACLLTTQQRSGPGSSVSKFISQVSFPLDYEKCCRASNLKSYAAQCLSSFGGIRFSKKIGEQIQLNFKWLENKGAWTLLLKMMNNIKNKSTAEEERNVAEFISKNMHGFGPKQSRNLLQTLGLTRHEIPIDSRITKWLNEFGFPVKLSVSALSDDNYYSFVLDGIQELCVKCDIYPCVLDAAIFSSYDSDWSGYDGVF